MWIGLQGRFAQWAMRRAALDLTKQIDVYRAMDDDGLALILVVATYARIQLALQGVLREGSLDGSRERKVEDALAVMPIGRRIKKAQRKGNFVAAAGLLVWLHSLRALNAAELRDLGRLMWRELARGFPHIENALQRADQMFGTPLSKSDVLSLDCYTFIPNGLDQKPQAASGKTPS